VGVKSFIRLADGRSQSKISMAEKGPQGKKAPARKTGIDEVRKLRKAEHRHFTSRERLIRFAEIGPSSGTADLRITFVNHGFGGIEKELLEMRGIFGRRGGDRSGEFAAAPLRFQ
jgi:hypothetical protein